MDAKDFIKYAVIGVVLFFAISTIVSLILTVLTFVFATALTVAAIGATIFLFSAIAQGLSNSRESESDNSVTEMSQKERIENLKKSYINGNISEEEFEKRLDVEFGGADEEFILERKTEKDYND